MIINKVKDAKEVNGLKKFSIELFQTLKDLAQNETNIVIVTHDNADVDAISSVVGLYYLLSNFLHVNSSNIIAYVPNISKGASFFCEKINVNDILEFQNNIIELHDKPKCVIVVDSNSIDLALNKESIGDVNSIIIIDHHNIPNYLIKKANTDAIQSENERINEHEKINKYDKLLNYYINPKSSSCAEIIADLWKLWIQIQNNEQISTPPNNKQLIEEKISQILLNGIFVDSANLKFSDNSILPILTFLGEMGAKIDKVGHYRLQKRFLDERIARLKGAIRVEEPIILGKDFVFVFTKVNAHEASVCRSLINLGADIAFCLSKQKKKKYRISARTSYKLQNETDIDLGILLEAVGREISASGGGHKGAAGIRGENPPDNLKDILLKKLKNEINHKIHK